MRLAASILLTVSFLLSACAGQELEATRPRPPRPSLTPGILAALRARGLRTVAIIEIDHLGPPSARFTDPLPIA